MNRCAICGEPAPRPTDMCSPCERSYERDAHNDGSVMEAMIWAARRARWYAERRKNEPRNTALSKLIEAAVEYGAARDDASGSATDRDTKAEFTGEAVLNAALELAHDMRGDS